VAVPPVDADVALDPLLDVLELLELDPHAASNPQAASSARARGARRRDVVMVFNVCPFSNRC
jgi:hypothetical protein